MATRLRDIMEADIQPQKPQNPEINKKTELGLMKSLNISQTELQNLTDKSALDLIGQAHDKAEEIETIAFGLEDDNGEIIKVYVNAEEAEAFEKALGDMLGSEDDIEEVIQKLSDDYDIVSVEWPEERMNHGAAEPAQGELDNHQDDDVAAGEEEGGEEFAGQEYALDFDLTNKEKKASDDDKEEEPTDGKDKKDTEEEKPADTEEPAEDEDEDEDGKDKKDDEEKDDDDEEEKDDDEFDFGDLGGNDDEKPKKKKAKAKKDDKKEVKENFLFSDFLGKPLLVEKEEIFSKKELKLEDIFKTVQQQKIMKLLFLMDFPVDRLLSKKSLVRKSIRNKASEISSNSKAKLLINRLIKDLSTLLTHDDVYEKQHKLVSHFEHSDLKEASKDLEDKLTNKMQKVLIELYRELGVPDILLSTKIAQLKTDTRKTAKIFSTHSKIKMNFLKLSKVLGIHHDEEELKEAQEAPNADKAPNAENYSSDQFVNLVIYVAEKLGVPMDNLDYKKPAVIAAVRETKRNRNFNAIKIRLIALGKLLTENELTNEEMTNEESNHTARHQAADLGNWQIGKLGSSGLVLSVEDIAIKIKEKNLEVFKSSLENGMSTFIKDGNDEWQFKALDHGKEYIAINEESDMYLNGILLHEKDIDSILELLDEL